jgi:hypothetical protein
MTPTPVGPGTPTPNLPRKKLWGRGKFAPGYWQFMGPRQHDRRPSMQRPLPKMKKMMPPA